VAIQTLKWTQITGEASATLRLSVEKSLTALGEGACFAFEIGILVGAIEPRGCGFAPSFRSLPWQNPNRSAHKKTSGRTARFDVASSLQFAI
jgi:hypothetical protein